MKKILVLGKDGQLGRSLQAKGITQCLGRDELDLSKTETIFDRLMDLDFDILVNAAAYTAVDKAEVERKLAEKINGESLEFISKACNEKGALLIQISTDYVFGDTLPRPICETHTTIPESVYGASKLYGESMVQKFCERYFIIRTSWLYSNYGHNFMNTMLKLAETKSKINVVVDQVGSPTWVDDLADAVLEISRSASTEYGIYHYSNEGLCSWFDFAHAIFEITGSSVDLSPVESDAFPTKATRPSYSVLNKRKIRNTFNFQINHWRDSLNRCLEQKKSSK
ncbi:MAG: dTDP-4-dehydrorhamnose reductase [Cryomorphaceae bacterium]